MQVLAMVVTQPDAEVPSWRRHWGGKRPGRSNDGRRDRSLIMLAERILNSEEVAKELKQVHQYGIVVGQDTPGNPTDRFPSGRFMRLLES